MKLPYCHILYYQGHQIINTNGIYKIIDMALPAFLNLNEVKRKIDEYEQAKLQQLFDNLNPPNEKTAIGY